jgi:hypothetical protein
MSVDAEGEVAENGDYAPLAITGSRTISTSGISTSNSSSSSSSNNSSSRSSSSPSTRNSSSSSGPSKSSSSSGSKDEVDEEVEACLPDSRRTSSRLKNLQRSESQEGELRRAELEDHWIVLNGDDE